MQKKGPSPIVCPVCPRHCRLDEGETGFCRARRAEGGRVVAGNYGRITSLALDPIEKKPIAFFLAQRLRRERGNIGLAYTYNEPLVGWEFVRDCAVEVRRRGMCNVLVSNGCAEADVVGELAPLIDAANIDLKGPSQEFYDWTGGSFAAVCRTIEMLHRAGCHVEVTTLVIPWRNDSDESIDAIAERIAAVSPEIPLHVTRFFPRFQMADADPTPVATIRRLVSRARRILPHVLPGNC